MADYGVSTLGVKLHYIKGTLTKSDLASKKLSDWNKILTRINAIGEVTNEPEKIDASALEDDTTKNVAGRGTVSDNLDVTVNYTDDTAEEWEAILGDKITLWVEVPNSTKGFYTAVEVPSAIPQPAFDQNGLLTFVMSCTVNDFIGLADAPSGN